MKVGQLPLFVITQQSFTGRQFGFMEGQLLLEFHQLPGVCRLVCICCRNFFLGVFLRGMGHCICAWQLVDCPITISPHMDSQ